MKKIVSILLVALLMLSAVSAFAEGEVKIAQIEYAAHGTSCFAVISAVVQDDVIIAAKIDEFQFMGNREDVEAVGVPNAENFTNADGNVLGSKRENNELYSLNMQRRGSVVQIAANYDIIEAFCVGKTIDELEAILGGYTEETKADFVDVVSSATLADSLNYAKGILAAAKATKNETGTYTIYNVTGETVTELYLADNLTGEDGVNYAVNGFADGACWIITRTITAEEKEAGYSMTLKFKTESGYEGSFATLHIEVAPIYLLAPDAMTGATQISFRAPAN